MNRFVASFVLLTAVWLGPSGLADEPAPAKQKSSAVSLVVTQEKTEWRRDETPLITLSVKNDTDETVRFTIFWAILEIDGQKYHSRIPIPTLGGDGDWHKFPPRTLKEHSDKRLDGRHYATLVDRFSEEKPVPLELQPGEHTVRVHLGGKRSNELQFTILPDEDK